MTILLALGLPYCLSDPRLLIPHRSASIDVSCSYVGRRASDCLLISFALPLLHFPSTFSTPLQPSDLFHSSLSLDLHPPSTRIHRLPTPLTSCRQSHCLRRRRQNAFRPIKNPFHIKCPRLHGRTEGIHPHPRPPVNTGNPDLWPRPTPRR